MRVSQTANWALAAAVLLSANAAGLAAQHKPALGDLIKDTQQLSQEGAETTIVWWIPSEFWRVALSQDPNVTGAQMDTFIDILRPYTLVAVVTGKVGPFGGIACGDEAGIRASVRLVDRNGASYAPLAPKKLEPDARNFLAMMKPLLVKSVGPLGEHLHFVAFPAKDRRAKPIADAKQEGRFSVKLGRREFKWRLPLGSLLPPKTCPRCGEKSSGAYKFCPWCGAKLPTSPAGAEKGTPHR